MQYCNSFPRETVGSPSLEVFKIEVDTAQSNRLFEHSMELAGSLFNLGRSVT